jgi:hypothetical protein
MWDKSNAVWIFESTLTDFCPGSSAADTVTVAVLLVHKRILGVLIRHLLGPPRVFLTIIIANLWRLFRAAVPKYGEPPVSGAFPPAERERAPRPWFFQSAQMPQVHLSAYGCFGHFT